ncbi:hypothetical protein, variant 2 [Cryptococcus amylolentus CBS 6039]|uniref:Major facilitator superfamily (MFS) profile domain-containing protein n=1 Tax=Cryptococcus amylolentus CBS 6039 TaxID=1295533 RepID=A0A1E3HR69_9TREE|nr:hypothetical protein, variant 2 [Cryptococcus amylolentus CBS 6039]ODN78859.1 hypothetical protein, variant 2 [Cryptococcus amylolentus CBS 6039]
MSSHSGTLVDEEKGVPDANDTVSTTRSESVEDLYIDPAAEKELVWKIDLTILPLAILVYWVSYLDRANIANAKAAGMVASLGLGTYDFNTGACVYFVVYIFCEPFAGLAVKRWGFILIPISVLGFAVITLATAWIKNSGQFYAVRCLLGAVEAFSMPGLSYVLSRYYRRHELTARFGIFMLVAIGCSQGFGGLLSGALVDVGSIGNVKGWSLIFLVEGIITIGIAIFLIIFFPSDPTTTRMFTPEQRKLALMRLQADAPPGEDTKEPISWAGIKMSFLNLNMAAYCYMYIASECYVPCGSTKSNLDRLHVIARSRHLHDVHSSSHLPRCEHQAYPVSVGGTAGCWGVHRDPWVLCGKQTAKTRIHCPRRRRLVYLCLHYSHLHRPAGLLQLCQPSLLCPLHRHRRRLHLRSLRPRLGHVQRFSRHYPLSHRRACHRPRIHWLHRVNMVVHCDGRTYRVQGRKCVEYRDECRDGAGVSGVNGVSKEGESVERRRW